MDRDTVLHEVLDKILVGRVVSPMAEARGEDFCDGLVCGWNLARATVNQELLVAEAKRLNK